MKDLEIIGIDVAKKKLDVCAIVDGKDRKKVFDNNEVGFKSLLEWIGKLGWKEPHVCMEATGCYSEGVAEFLHQAGWKVSVVNPMQIKAFRHSKLIRQKNGRLRCGNDCQILLAE